MACANLQRSTHRLRDETRKRVFVLVVSRARGNRDHVRHVYFRVARPHAHNRRSERARRRRPNFRECERQSFYFAFVHEAERKFQVDPGLKLNILGTDKGTFSAVDAATE